jgi:hypothetical protein
LQRSSNLTFDPAWPIALLSVTQLSHHTAPSLVLLQDLREARQAARLFDRASRLETGRFSALKLRPNDIESWHGAPDFSRFPLLACLQLQGTPSQHAPDQLRECFALAERPGPRHEAACAVLAALGELDGRAWEIGGLTDINSVLKHVPGITSLRVNMHTHSTEEVLTMLATLPAMVPHIKSLELITWSDFNEDCACALGSLPCLRSLRMDSSDDAPLLATLPCSRLTSLDFGGWQCCPALGCDLGLPWPHLRELRGIDLPAKGWAERLALGLPHLTLLVAQPSGDWGTHAPAAFPKVLRAMFLYCPSGFRRMCMQSLVPNVECLEVMYHDDDTVLLESPTAMLSGLTRLSHLAYGATETLEFLLPPSLCEWQALAAAPRLAELKCDAVVEDLARLALLTGLESLHLTLALSCEISLHGDLDVNWGFGRKSGRVDMGVVGSALACMPKLKRLVLDVPGGRKDMPSLVNFAKGLRGVTRLRLDSTDWTAEQLCIFVSRVKAPLRNLWLHSVPSAADAPGFAWLLNEQAEQGLIIQGMSDFPNRCLHTADDFNMSWQCSR